MKTLWTISALCLLPVAAMAADMPARGMFKAPVAVVAAPSWTGFYAGVHAGYGWGDFEASDVDPLFRVLIDENLNHKPTGGVFGGHAGYNYQVGNLVFGVEGDGSYATIRGSVFYDFPLLGGTFSDQQTSKIDALFSARGRIGYAFGPALLYATGGVATARVSSTFTASLFGQSLSTADQAWHTGYTVGGGVEYKLAQNWSTRVEYLYADLGEQTHTVEPFALTLNVVRVGLTYQFGAPAAAVAARY
jgi:outer membrane immunogenic protein